MSKEDLEKAAMEIPAEATSDTKPGATVQSAPPPTPQPPDPQTVAVLAGFWALAAGVICQRLGVPPLSPEEAQMLGAASTQVMDLYLPKMDAKAAAWIGLGGGLVAVGYPRFLEYQQRHEAPDAPPAEQPAMQAPLQPVTRPSPRPKPKAKRKTARKTKRA
ncbi:MAG: hypothetical protein JKY94_01970 [Rhodobacteraceae bacterium]|nr:hypothetical protein [Paracoccaceae bacterium]